MNFSPKSRFFLTFASALLAGGIIGFLGSALSEDNTPASTPPGNALSSRAPLLKISSRTNDNPLPAPTAANMEKLMGQYMRMNDEELLRELNRCTRNLIPDADYSMILALRYLSYRLGVLSPEKALHWLDSTSPYVKEEVFTHIIRGGLQSDMKQTTAYLLQHKNDYKYTSYHCRDIAIEMVQQSPEQALDWLLTLDDGARRYLIADTVGFIPDEYLSEMPRYLKKIPPGDLESSNLRSSIAYGWAKVDCAAAKAWIDSLPLEQRPTPLTTVVRILAKTDWITARDWIATLPSDRKEEPTSVALASLAEVDWTAAKSWIDSLPPEQKQEPVSAAIVSLAMNNEEKAKNELLLMDKDLHAETAKNTASKLAYEFPDKSLDWVSSFISAPDGIARAAEEIGSHLSENKLNLVFSYLEQQPSGPIKESLLDGLVKGIDEMNLEPEDTLQIGFTLSQFAQSPEKKEKLLRITLDSWVEFYPENVHSWLEKTSSLSPELKAEYQTKCKAAETKNKAADTK